VSDDLVHPPPELLSQHRDGLLPPDLTRQVRAHVADCRRCRTELAALVATTRRLRDAGRHPVPMPSDVSARLEAAIADEARGRAATTRLRRAGGAGRVPINDVREPSRHPRRSRILVAAAIVAVLAVGGVAANSMFDRGGGSRPPVAGNAASKMTGSVHTSGPNIAAKTDTPGGRTVASALAIDRGNFKTVAPLAITTGARAGRSAGGCFRAAVTGYDPRTWLSATIDWHGERAWLLFDPRHTRGVVVDCSAHPRSMFHHQF
jgi:hypothetical protein